MGLAFDSQDYLFATDDNWTQQLQSPKNNSGCGCACGIVLIFPYILFLYYVTGRYW